MTALLDGPPRLLVASDLADPAAEALTQAYAQAKLWQGTLAVCHVAPSSGDVFPARYPSEASQEAGPDERLRAKVRDTMRSVTGEDPSSWEIFIDHGTAWVEILRRAESWGATLVVVGAHGHPGARRVLLGSVAEAVVKHARCPVLVVRRAAQRGLVICATDLSPPSLPAVEAAVAAARLRGAKLLVLHVIDQGAPLAQVGSSAGITPLVLSPELLHDLREAARAKIGALLAKVHAQADVLIVEGQASSAILTCIDERRPELAVVGTRGHTPLASLLLGSVAEHVARRATTSVLVVPRVER